MPTRRPLLTLPELVWPLTDGAAFAAAAARVDDWPAVVDEATREGVLGLLALRLCATRPMGVPAPVIAELESLRVTGARRALRMTGQLLRIVELFGRHGIECVPIKGPALAEDVYGDATVRSSCDLDILVRPRDAPAARNLLLENDFHDLGRYAGRIMRRGRHSESEIPLARRGGEPMVDLHWRLTVGYSRRAISTERLLSRARALPLLGRSVLAPSAEDQLLVTALHASRHDWRPLELRLAVALQVARPPGVPLWITFSTCGGGYAARTI